MVQKYSQFSKDADNTLLDTKNTFYNILSHLQLLLLYRRLQINLLSISLESVYFLITIIITTFCLNYNEICIICMHSSTLIFGVLLSNLTSKNPPQTSPNTILYRKYPHKNKEKKLAVVYAIYIKKFYRCLCYICMYIDVEKNLPLFIDEIKTTSNRLSQIYMIFIFCQNNLPFQFIKVSCILMLKKSFPSSLMKLKQLLIGYHQYICIFIFCQNNLPFQFMKLSRNPSISPNNDIINLNL
eukprot:TRINITY_DN3871_c0_g1_i4.p1 TRINITY_DN3871_c0_g1~~TRINITY_DN3871_c0_g1_i4.p1  ORF type:complete len:264 (-),score=-21.68 TRINITY_DN3871_c0_g1_i4:2605-3327(-)